MGHREVIGLAIATQRIREEALNLFRDGVRPTEALLKLQQIGASRTSIYRWHKDWKQEESTAA